MLHLLNASFSTSLYICTLFCSHFEYIWPLNLLCAAVATLMMKQPCPWKLREYTYIVYRIVVVALFMIHFKLHRKKHSRPLYVFQFWIKTLYNCCSSTLMLHVRVTANWAISVPHGRFWRHFSTFLLIDHTQWQVIKFSTRVSVAVTDVWEGFLVWPWMKARDTLGKVSTQLTLCHSTDSLTSLAMP